MGSHRKYFVFFQKNFNILNFCKNNFKKLSLFPTLFSINYSFVPYLNINIFRSKKNKKKIRFTTICLRKLINALKILRLYIRSIIIVSIFCITKKKLSLIKSTTLSYCFYKTLKNRFIFFYTKYLFFIKKKNIFLL